MSLDAIQQVLDGQFKTLPGFDDARTAWPNKPFVPDSAWPIWWAPQISSSTRRPAGAGEKGAIVWSGTYQVLVRTRKNAGTKPSNDAVGAILTLFPRGLTLPTGDGINVTCEVPYPRPAYEDGGWYTGIAIIPWFGYELPT